MLGNQYAQYQNNSVMTASSQELTLMLYNGAIKFGNRALDAMEDRNIQNVHDNIMKVQAIIEELRITLDNKYPIAREMDDLYEFILKLLVEANIEKSGEKLEQAIYFIREFRDTWQSITKK